MMEHSTWVGNRLLAALPPADFDLLAPHLRNVSLERDLMVVRSGDRIEQICFPRSGTIAFMLDMPNGQTVATAVIGNEGAVGVLAALGPSRFPMTAVVRVAGTSLQISSARLFAALSHSSALRRVVQMAEEAHLLRYGASEGLHFACRGFRAGLPLLNVLLGSSVSHDTPSVVCPSGSWTALARAVDPELHHQCSEPN